MGRISNELNNLKETDLWSLILFALFKVREIPEFASLSELAYVLDKKNLLNLCALFGGMTITIPTINDLELMLYSLLLYEYIDVKHYSMDEALDMLDQDNIDYRDIKKNYLKVRDLLNQYSFSSRGK